MARNRDAQPERKPKKQRIYHQVWEAYQFTKRFDPHVTWIVLAGFVGTLAVAGGIAVVLRPGGMGLFFVITFGVMMAVLVATFLLSRRVQRAQYAALEGRPGGALSLLRNGPINRSWVFEENPVAVNVQQDLVLRGIGRAGIALVSEGPVHRVTKLLETERRRIARVLPNVPVTLIQCGDGSDQVPLSKLEATLRKLPTKLTKAEMHEVTKRLRAIGGASLPIPKGVDPLRVRPDRKGMRGR